MAVIRFLQDGVEAWRQRRVTAMQDGKRNDGLANSAHLDARSWLVFGVIYGLIGCVRYGRANGAQPRVETPDLSVRRPG
ncbi:hypothetical protein MAHJHV61_35680 [Mycobacterium avium subsp. hominissuis]